MAASTKSLGHKTAANALKQGAKRAVLSDVSNRAPLIPVEHSKPASSNAKRNILARPSRREPLQQIIPTVPEAHDVDDHELTDVEADMDVDQLDIAFSMSEVQAHYIARGVPVTEPIITELDRLELRRVDDEFVDEWDEWGDISMVQEYADDIFTYMHALEVILNLYLVAWLT